MTRSRRLALREWLCGAPRTDTTTDQPTLQETEVPSTTTPTSSAEKSLAHLRAQLDELETETANDPLELADDLAAWKARDQLRRDRRVGIVSEIRRAERFGDLIGNDTAMADLREYTTATADARAMLGKIVRTGSLPTQGENTLRDARGAKHLKAWLEQLQTLGSRLAASDPDAARVLLDEWRRWYAARHAWLVAYAAADGEGRRVPEPELTGGLPAGLAYGPHTIDPNGDPR